MLLDGLIKVLEGSALAMSAVRRVLMYSTMAAVSAPCSLPWKVGITLRKPATMWAPGSIIDWVM